MTAPTGLGREHFRQVAMAILDGNVIPVLGAGANRCDRGDRPFQAGTTLPDGRELADVLARRFVPDQIESHDLVRVAQAAVLAGGDGPVFKRLREIFVGDYKPTTLHGFLADLPGFMERRGLPVRSQLIVTMNYDDLLERAFEAAGRPYDLVYYLGHGGAHRRSRGRFAHVTSDRGWRVITIPKKYDQLSTDDRTVILKLHGAARRDEHEDSWVITEDHYIEYLAHTNLSELVPVRLLDKLLNSHFLFLGYAMRDWNLRVILHHIWTQRDNSWEAWAVQLDPERLDEAFWRHKGVDIQSASLDRYIAELRSCMDTVESTL